jgi:hypothetical protein
MEPSLVIVVLAVLLVVVVLFLVWLALRLRSRRDEGHRQEAAALREQAADRASEFEKQQTAAAEAESQAAEALARAEAARARAEEARREAEREQARAEELAERAAELSGSAESIRAEQSDTLKRADEVDPDIDASRAMIAEAPMGSADTATAPEEARDVPWDAAAAPEGAAPAHGDVPDGAPAAVSDEAAAPTGRGAAEPGTAPKGTMSEEPDAESVPATREAGGDNRPVDSANIQPVPWAPRVQPRSEWVAPRDQSPFDEGRRVAPISSGWSSHVPHSGEGDRRDGLTAGELLDEAGAEATAPAAAEQEESTAPATEAETPEEVTEEERVDPEQVDAPDDIDLVEDGGYGVGSAAPPPSGNQPRGHPVKATKEAMTYHEPGGTWYDAVVPDVWFTDVEAAERAGFRPAGD